MPRLVQRRCSPLSGQSILMPVSRFCHASTLAPVPVPAQPPRRSACPDRPVDLVCTGDKLRLDRTAHASLARAASQPRNDAGSRWCLALQRASRRSARASALPEVRSDATQKICSVGGRMTAQAEAGQKGEFSRCWAQPRFRTFLLRQITALTREVRHDSGNHEGAGLRAVPGDLLDQGAPRSAGSTAPGA